MEEFSKEKNEIMKTLEERGAKLPCPRCGHKKFAILEGYFVQPIQTDLKGTVLGGLSIPSAVIACINCGYLSQHALGAIGLLPKKEAKIEK